MCFFGSQSSVLNNIYIYVRISKLIKCHDNQHILSRIQERCESFVVVYVYGKFVPVHAVNVIYGYKT
jgi:hypothetical protein